MELTDRSIEMPSSVGRPQPQVVRCACAVCGAHTNAVKAFRITGSCPNCGSFDLTPIVARAQEFERLSEEVRLERRLTALARERVTILRRDIVKMIGVAVEEGAAGDWTRLQREFALLSGRLV